MAFTFKIWNQSNDGKTMAIRVEDVNELAQLAAACTQPDALGTYQSLQDYLTQAATANVEPEPYIRVVDVCWLRPTPFGVIRLCQERIFRVERSGNLRQMGGYASQGYCMVDPSWWADMLPHHLDPIQVEYIAGGTRDLIVVTA